MNVTNQEERGLDMKEPSDYRWFGDFCYVPNKDYMELLREIENLKSIIKMIPVTEKLPPFGEGLRVLIYTDGVDFNGEQYFDVKADELNECYFSDPDDQPEILKAATHWCYLPKL